LVGVALENLEHALSVRRPCQLLRMCNRKFFSFCGRDGSAQLLS
jgi:hypothetical protein